MEFTVSKKVGCGYQDKVGLSVGGGGSDAAARTESSNNKKR
ncbi:hypothetical protein A2U01_0095571 [Trifolium medium]|uniref:Uncharacterized protein n=1 Tax=Trifolium medium TaxID=97028 RepID=A0A392UNI2_9FABA|nr:hypothetical protein [Trifolium medium]